MKLTDIYNARSIKDAARLKLARWFNKVEKLGVDNFYTVIDTFKNHYDTILNFFVNRATNANAESFNAKVKAFKAQFRGVTDIPFFLYRLMKRPLKSKICIKQKYRNLLKLRYLRIFEVFLNSFYRVLHAEREGFEPPAPLSATVFKTVVIDHSTISPSHDYVTLIVKRVQR